MLQLKDIKKSFQSQTVLDGLSLDIQEGERFVLLGPSGCGKTTLLRLIAGFETADQGSVSLGGEILDSRPVEKRPVGFIFQRHALFPHMNVYDNIAVGPRIAQLKESETRKRIGELLEILRLTAKRSAWPNQLSGGESQRVALARALINRPKVLLLDEPLSAIDENLRQDLGDELVDIQKTFGTTFVFVTHDRQEAFRLAHRVGVLNGGRLEQVGTPDTLCESPATPFVVRFLGDTNAFEAVVQDIKSNRVRVRTKEGDTLYGESAMPLSKGKPCIGYIRPERIRFVNKNDSVAETTNLVDCDLLERTVLGSRLMFRVKMQSGNFLKVETGYQSPSSFDKEQENIKVYLEPSSLHLFPPEPE
ncbi:MAG: ABC transporter ATP-binding protein [Candidatus Nitronauta litoralis]|uniref:ABC transporter ATP-binding protein n=1 Tax=Candidatus Nitronauta litoralis TaxID=2705533 RepID=A0A7T0BV74_9BACT|nr:MAG: ABC transporter ATP-binding protein [Candidatus Nitronauta litoralis]